MLSAFHIEVGDDHLADEHGLVSLQLVHALELFLIRFDGSVYLLFRHAALAKQFLEHFQG